MNLKQNKKILVVKFFSNEAVLATVLHRPHKHAHVMLTKDIGYKTKLLFETTASKYHFLRRLLLISVIYASVLCETHCSAHSLGLSFHPPKQ